MISKASEFKFTNRGFKDTLVLIPGWATDYKIFSALELNYNYLLPLKFSLYDFKRDLLEFLDKNNIKKISLFGWSLGGFLAYEFALKNSERLDRIFLISIRKKFDSGALKEIALKLKKNKKGYLYKFYLDCFSGNDKAGLAWFRKNLLRGYIYGFKLKELLGGLDYLSQTCIKPESLLLMKDVTIIHGEEDRIAPINEALEIKIQLAQADFICLKNAGHFLFLNPEFNLRV